MFSQVFEPCLENISLIRLLSLPANNNNENGSHEHLNKQLTTLGEVIRSSHFALFYVLRSSGGANLSDSLKALMATKNCQKSSSAQSSPARLKRLFGLRGKKPPATTTTTVSLIVVDLNPDTSATDQLPDGPDIYYMPPQHYSAKGRLLRSLNFSNTPPPAVIVVDCAELKVVTAQGRRALQEDPQGLQFPWPDANVGDLLRAGGFIRNAKRDDGTFAIESCVGSLNPCVKGLYFGAKWCPPCRSFAKQLASLYESIKRNIATTNSNFEIIFCSSDRSEASFREHFTGMPWLALPFTHPDHSDKLKRLTRALDVNGIPSFILLDENNSLISRQGLKVMMADPEGKNFPWSRSPLYELTELNAHRIAELPSLILFTEGSPDDSEFSKQILTPAADLLFSQLTITTPTPAIYKSDSTESGSIDSTAAGGDKPIPVCADPLQVFYTGEDPICDYILESLGQGNSDLPLLMIVDTTAGYMAICDKPDVGEQIVLEWIDEYRQGKANIQPLPSSSSSSAVETDNGNGNDNRLVGGIPVNLIEQIVNNQQQQQSINK